MNIKNSQPRPRRFYHKKIFYIIPALCLSIGGCAGIMNWQFKPRLDPPQGSVTLPGLKGQVTVRRDAYGIPFVDAGTMEDMAMAIGYVNASDRLDQMIGMKLVSQGRLSEMVGKSVLSLDIYRRTINLKRGPYPAPGDFFTLNVSAYTLGRDFDTWLIPSMRLVVDFSKEEPMAAVNSSGQSDNPSSPHYDDGITAWREGRYILFPFGDGAMKDQYREIMILRPAEQSRP